MTPEQRRERQNALKRARYWSNPEYCRAKRKAEYWQDVGGEPKDDTLIVHGRRRTGTVSIANTEPNCVGLTSCDN